MGYVRERTQRPALDTSLGREIFPRKICWIYISSRDELKGEREQSVRHAILGISIDTNGPWCVDKSQKHLLFLVISSDWATLI